MKLSSYKNALRTTSVAFTDTYQLQLDIYLKLWKSLGYYILNSTKQFKFYQLILLDGFKKQPEGKIYKYRHNYYAFLSIFFSISSMNRKISCMAKLKTILMN